MKLSIDEKVRWLIGGFALGMFLLIMVHLASAKDVGQWENSDPRIKEWYRSLMRPDAPNVPCCGESDAYYADKVTTRGDKTYATITDTRPDAPLGRPHIPPGTEFEIPPEKLKWDRGNPTGHNVLFVSSQGTVWCFVQGSGT
jgi:hypothetical protein